MKEKDIEAEDGALKATDMENGVAEATTIEKVGDSNGTTCEIYI